MSTDKQHPQTPPTPSDSPDPMPPAGTEPPAHSTPEERERLKDFNKDGIPPGAW
jgi:hypothetical protein